MASRRQPFQGQIGINGTELTTAITCGDFKTAEEIVESTSDPSYLNDGRCEDIPLHLVLNNNQYAKNCRNLKLARLLVQKGASPNLRILYADMVMASPSPFEELVVYYEVLKSYVAGVSDGLCEELEMFFETDELKLEFLTNTIDLDNVKCLPDLENCKKLIEQTSDLIDIFLQYGSDPSVHTTFSLKSLFHWVIEHEDVDLAVRFLDTCRVDLDICDVHGRTPLMDTILRNSPKDSLRIYESMCDTTETVDINGYDCCGETSLFRAVFVGATEMANRLCKDGAELKSFVSLSQVPVSTCREAQHSDALIFCGALLDSVSPMTTPFLAPLLADSPVMLRYSHISTQDFSSKIFHPHKHLIDKIILASVSPLIDHGSFSKEAVASQVMSLLYSTHFEYLVTGDVNPVDLLTLVFGQVSCGLRQLCVRTVFDNSLVVSQITTKTWPQAMSNVFCNHCCEGIMTKDKIRKLVEILGLPQSFQIFFEMEAAKYQTCNLIMSHRSMECDQTCSNYDGSMFHDDDDDESYDSEFSSVYADSDSLLFFSSDISEESSEEVDDLSDEDLSGSEEDDEDEMKAEETKQEAPGLKKIKYKEQDSSSSESENMRVVVETFCEDLAEGVAQDHPKVCCDKYQRLNDESTSTTESHENLTASDSISDSLS